MTSSVKLPVAVGVPVTAPVEVFRVSPVGKAPDATENVKGDTPPEMLDSSEGLLKATPTSPVVPVLAHVKVGGGTNVKTTVTDTEALVM